MASLTRLGRWSLLLLAALGLAGARGAESPAPPPAVSGPQEVAVVGVFLDAHTREPIVVLQGKRDKRTFGRNRLFSALLSGDFVVSVASVESATSFTRRSTECERWARRSKRMSRCFCCCSFVMIVV